MNVLLEVEELSVDIATAAGSLHAVQQVSFGVEHGRTLCIVGESGCGKSLTALAIMDLLPRRAVRSASRLVFAGEDLIHAGAEATARLRGDRLSMIFQEPMTSLNPVFTIGDQLTAVLRQHRPVSRRAARDRAVYLLDRVGISAPEARLAQFPHELSGGLRQRVMIAMALMCDPVLLLADEPTTALDVTIQAELLRLLVDLQAEFKMGMILITHDLGVVSRIADQVAVMYAGQIVEAGSVEQIFGAPQHPYTRGLMNCLPAPDRPRLQHLPSIRGTVPSLIGELSGCHFRDRCEYAHWACNASIDLRPARDGHPYRCVLPPDGLSAGSRESIEATG